MDNLRGSLFMVAAMAAFAVEDVFVKAATRTLPVGQTLILFGLGGVAVFVVLTRTRGDPVFHPAFLSRPMLIRAACELVGRLCYTLALALTDLSSTSAILQATPLAVALGALVFFDEPVGPRRWLAIGVGFFGVLLILRPGLGAFEPNSIFAVLGTLGFAGRDLATRAAPGTMTNIQLGIYGFLVLTLAGVVALVWTGEAVWPGAGALACVGAAIAVGVLAYTALMRAVRTGEISLVAPFRYTRLIFAIALGIAVFGERPDVLTLTGAAIIVASGLYSALRERARKARGVPSP